MIIGEASIISVCPSSPASTGQQPIWRQLLGGLTMLVGRIEQRNELATDHLKNAVNGDERTEQNLVALVSIARCPGVPDAQSNAVKIVLYPRCAYLQFAFDRLAFKQYFLPE